MGFVASSGREVRELGTDHGAGQLDGTIIRFSAPSWEDSHCQVPEPTRMPLPCRADAISAGRRHLLVLDEDNLIWEQRSWGRVRPVTLGPL